jgi:hypothetical protein
MEGENFKFQISKFKETSKANVAPVPPAPPLLLVLPPSLKLRRDKTARQDGPLP